jgi:hypothetical protein
MPVCGTKKWHIELQLLEFSPVNAVSSSQTCLLECAAALPAVKLARTH